MILPIAFILGFIIGALRAKRGKGQFWDIVQYGIVHGLALSLLALVVTILFRQFT